MSDFNRVILLGRIGNDPELKQSAQGKAYLKLSLATNYYGAGEDKTAHWHRVMVFGAQAEVCGSYLRKGSQVMVEGFLESRTYSDAEGRKTNRVSVVANRVQFLNSRQSAELVSHQEEQPIAATA